MKRALQLLLFFTTLVVNAQPDSSFVFDKLEVIDTLSADRIAILKRKSLYKSGNYFVSHLKAPDVDSIPVLVSEKGRKAFVYALPVMTGCIRCWYDLLGFSNKKRYFTLTTIYSHSATGAGGGNDIVTHDFIIIDIARAEYVTINTYTYDFMWQFEDNGTGRDELRQYNEQRVYSSEVIMNNDHVTVLNSCFEHGAQKECPDSGGLYKIANGKLIKEKKYNRQTKRLEKP